MGLLLAGLSILIIGDSHLATPNYLISTLHDDLSKRGAVVHTLGICGTNAGDWLKVTPGTCGGAERIGTGKVTLLGSNAATRPVSQLIEQEKPGLVVVVMGDTMAAYDKPNFPKTWAWQQVTGLTGAIAATGTKCVWVGPAWGSEGGKYGKTYARAELMSTFLAANAAPCSYVDSLKLSPKGQWATIDGQHLTTTGYQQWGAAIGKAISTLPAVK